jgi:hypothetical protein
MIEHSKADTTPASNWSRLPFPVLKPANVLLQCRRRSDRPPSHHRFGPGNNLNCANAGVAAGVRIRYHSAPSLHLLLVCANANPSVLSLFLPL